MLSGLGMDHQIALVDSKHGARYPLLAMPNSTVATVDDAGAIDGQYSYEPFGEVKGEGVADYPFLFTGRTPVGGGLYYYRARYYDPLIGRFLSQDPQGFAGGDVNAYGYARDSPFTHSDPSGEAAQAIGGAIIVASLAATGWFAYQLAHPSPRDEIPGPCSDEEEQPSFGGWLWNQLMRASAWIGETQEKNRIQRENEQIQEDYFRLRPGAYGPAPLPRQFHGGGIRG
jgi:RHS repeat-associated protein